MLRSANARPGRRGRLSGEGERLERVRGLRPAERPPGRHRIKPAGPVGLGGAAASALGRLRAAAAEDHNVDVGATPRLSIKSVHPAVGSRRGSNRGPGMPTPREIYETPEHYLAELCAADDSELENQYIDRKEACRPDSQGVVSRAQVGQLKQHIIECISAFANKNPEGGLVVVGIGDDGSLIGIQHLSDEQRRTLTGAPNTELRNDATLVRQVDLPAGDGTTVSLLLYYAPYTERAICETNGASPKAWTRNGPRNDPMSRDQIDQLRREKGAFDEERQLVTPYRREDVDDGVLGEARRSWELDEQRSDEDFLHQIGAIESKGEQLYFTKAGLLFFGANPQRVLSASEIRLLRFDGPVDGEDRGLPTVPEKRFTGSIVKQIQDFRSYVWDSGLFKVYQRRKSEGGFHEEPELPPIAVDESVVNAVAHCDYGVGRPIECARYRDGFRVTNPGRLIQRNETVPAHFSLDERRLDHAPRNPTLIRWLGHLRDGNGKAFVQALSEGTRRMQQEMRELDLPPPVYDVRASETVLTLYNDAERREAPEADGEDVSEYANLFALRFRHNDGRPAEQPFPRERRRELLTCLRDALVAHGWFADRLARGTLTAHRQGQEVRVPAEARRYVRIYPGYHFSVRDYFGRTYLNVDFTAEVKNTLKVSELLNHLSAPELISRSAVGRTADGWQRGRLTRADKEWVTLRLFDVGQEQTLPADDVIPDLPVHVIKTLLSTVGVRFDLSRAIRQASLASSTTAARERAEKTSTVVDVVAQQVFPLRCGALEASLATEPLPLRRTLKPPQDSATYLPVSAIEEPVVEFHGRRDTADIRDGITRYGSYDQPRTEIEIVPVVLQEHRDQAAALIERLQKGKYRYRGSEATFGVRFTYTGIATADGPGGLERECRRLLQEHPDWRGDEKLARVMLVHAPEAGYALDDTNSPYYTIKRMLVEAGVPCQMIDSGTLLDPDWKDLNLALNLVAKCGITPWVLPRGLPDADFFIGLSYTQPRREGRRRLMGYANVFSEFGQWQFYSGSTTAFDYEHRAEQLGALVQETLDRLGPRLSQTPSIHIHYSARFSKNEIHSILDAARQRYPEGVFTFVWINSHHHVRLYDARPETNGSLPRGSFVLGAPNQFYLSTTGYNPFRKLMGTPVMPEINVRRYTPDRAVRNDLDPQALAKQVLALTKLNWASTDAMCAEPITTKFAGDIAYLTSAFMADEGTFQLHPCLEETPWFI